MMVSRNRSYAAILRDIPTCIWPSPPFEEVKEVLRTSTEETDKWIGSIHIGGGAIRDVDDVKHSFVRKNGRIKKNKPDDKPLLSAKKIKKKR
jgi:hypothetical protein